MNSAPTAKLASPRHALLTDTPLRKRKRQLRRGGDPSAQPGTTQPAETWAGRRQRDNQAVGSVRVESA